MSAKTPANTLAQTIGQVPHVSPLLQKLRRVGLASTDAMTAAAIARGCGHYAGIGGAALSPRQSHPETISVSDEQLAIALLHPSNPYDPMLIRIGCQLLSKISCDPRKLISLARQERCEPILKHIALAGNQTEPENPFWQFLLCELRHSSNARKDTLPHPSRFQRVVGMTNPKKPVLPKITWLRATP